jgi:hypothetical protein
MSLCSCSCDDQYSARIHDPFHIKKPAAHSVRSGDKRRWNLDGFVLGGSGHAGDPVGAERASACLLSYWPVRRLSQ